MRKRRYEILLPLKFNDGQPVPAEALNQTREELPARFDGLTVHPPPVRSFLFPASPRLHSARARQSCRPGLF
jgi:hypothetical protein